MSHIRIVTNKPVAFDSPDHIQPWGTSRDNSISLAFNRKLTWWLSTSKLRVLDLGCAGGGFVKSILDRGGFAVGVEGSDYSRLTKRAEWATIPDQLFTADLTEPFQLLEVDGEGKEHPAQFNVITAWEVIEHIHREKLHAVFENIWRHLSPHGVVVASVSPNEEIIQGVRLHQTVEKKDWWVSKFLDFGFVHHPQVCAYFADDWIRGEDNAPGSFHLVLTRRGESLPKKNRFRVMVYIAQLWDVARRIGRAVKRTTPSPVRRAYRRIRGLSHQSKL